MKYNIILNAGATPVRICTIELKIVHRLQTFILKKAGASTELLTQNEAKVQDEINMMNAGSITTYSARQHAASHHTEVSPHAQVSYTQ